MYKVWKASINEYRVYNTKTKVLYTTENLILKDCKFVVNKKGFKKAQKRNFKGTRDMFDYFAYIKCKSVELNKNLEINLGKIFFNPFKNSTFVDRETNQTVHKVKELKIIGNLITY